jgi:ABC-type lipoprotein release transport system permease subunit
MIPRLSAQARKSVADIVRRRAQSVLIAAAILLPVAGLTAASTADNMLSAAYAFSVGIGGSQPDVTIVTDKVTPAMLAAISRAGNVGSVQDATVLSTLWYVTEAPGYVDFTIVGYMSQAGLAALPAFTYVPGPVQRQPLRTEEIALRLHAPAAYQATVRALGPGITAAGATVLSVLPPEHGVPVAQLSGILSLVRTLILVALLLAVTLLLSTITALVAEQTAVIGTMKALGGTRARIAGGYLMTIALYCAVATLTGIAAGVVLGAKLGAALARSIPLAPGPFVLSPAVIGQGLAVGFGVPMLAALVPLWLGTRVSVREALADFGVTRAGVRAPRRLARLFAGRSIRVPPSVRLASSGLFRRPWRAALSIVTIAVAVGCFLAVVSLATSVSGSVASVYANFHADAEVNVGGSHSYREVTSVFGDVPNVGRVERVGWFGSQTPWGKVSVWGVEPASRLYTRHVTSGRWFTAGDSGVLLVGDDLARRSGLRIGSTVSLPGPGGSPTMTFTVIGTIRESVDDLSQSVGHYACESESSQASEPKLPRAIRLFRAAMAHPKCRSLQARRGAPTLLPLTEPHTIDLRVCLLRPRPPVTPAAICPWTRAPGGPTPGAAD